MDEFDGGMGLPDDELMGDEAGAADGNGETEGESEAGSAPKSGRRSSGGPKKNRPNMLKKRCW